MTGYHMVNDICIPNVCAIPAPADTDGYDIIDNNELEANRFNVAVDCATGYEGTAVAVACTTDGEDYTLQGCSPIVCVTPINTDGYDVDETILNLGTGNFGVGVSCAAGYGGAAVAVACATNGEEYTLNGCSPVTCTRPVNTLGYDFSNVFPGDEILDGPTFGVSNIACDQHYRGRADAVVCDSNGEYTLTGCYTDDSECVRPNGLSHPEYNFSTGQEISLDMATFDVSGITCNPGYSGTPVVRMCQVDGDAYIVEGCFGDTCIRPQGDDAALYDFSNTSEINLTKDSLDVRGVTCIVGYKPVTGSYVQATSCTVNGGDYGLTPCTRLTCGDRTCPSGFNPRNNYSSCSSDNCDSYEDLLLCCSQNQICGSIGPNTCKNTYPGFINDPLTYNDSCSNEYCNIDNDNDKNLCCIPGCDEDKFLENGICNNCTPIPYSKDTANIECTNSYNSLFINVNSNDNCTGGKISVRGVTNDSCVDSEQTCRQSNICNRNGYVLDETQLSQPCAGDTCDFLSDKATCCKHAGGYETCSIGEVNNECIDGAKCKDGRIRQTVNDREGCYADTSRNFEECEFGEDISCIDGVRCQIGFKLNANDKCIVDTQNEFVCSDSTLNEECIGGRVICKGGFFYRPDLRECIPGSGIDAQTGMLDCSYGEVNDEYGNCVLEEIRNNIPTNLSFNSQNELTCKKGYRLTTNILQPCVLDSLNDNNDNNWVCQRSNNNHNDGERCCDPVRVNGEYQCSSRPVCISPNYEHEGDCVNAYSPKIDCQGSWSTCRADCKDSTYRISINRSGRGDTCKGENGVELYEDDKRSCRSTGACRLYEKNNILCGADLSNRIIEDEQNWIWEWNDSKTRDTCDRNYKGDLDNCNRKYPGNESTRKYCDKYENKCAGNTNPREDVDCYSFDKIPKSNIYELDRKGNGMVSCCDEFDVVKSFKRRNYRSFDEKDKRLREILNIRRNMDEQSISQLVR